MRGGPTGFVFMLRLLLGALGGCWSGKDLRTLPPHLEAAEGQAAETLGLTWSAQDPSSGSTLLLKGCTHTSEQR